MTPLLYLALLTSSFGADPGTCAATLKLQLPCSKGCTPIEVPYEPQPGDLLLEKRTSLVWLTLCTITLCGGVNHAAIVVSSCDGTVSVLENADFGAPVTIEDVVPAIAKKRGTLWVRRRRCPLTPKESENLTTFAYEQLGKPYDYLSICTVPVARCLLFVPKSRPDLGDVEASHWCCAAVAFAACVAANLVDPLKARPKCICSNDLMHDRLVDLSHGWEPPVRLIVEKAPCGH